MIDHRIDKPLATTKKIIMDSGSTPGTSVPLPSYEAHRSAGEYVRRSSDALRLRWSVDGPLTTAIMVINGPRIDPDTVTEPYCRPSYDLAFHLTVTTHRAQDIVRHGPRRRARQLGDLLGRAE